MPNLTLGRQSYFIKFQQRAMLSAHSEILGLSRVATLFDKLIFKTPHQLCSQKSHGTPVGKHSSLKYTILRFFLLVFIQLSIFQPNKAFFVTS